MTDIATRPWELDSSQQLELVALELIRTARRTRYRCLLAGLPLPEGALTYTGKWGSVTYRNERFDVELRRRDREDDSR